MSKTREILEQKLRQEKAQNGKVPENGEKGATDEAAPSSYAGEFAAIFGELPEKWRRYLKKHEAEAEQMLGELKGRLAQYLWVDELAGCRQERLARYGVDSPRAWMEYLAAVDDALEQNPAAALQVLHKCYCGGNAVPAGEGGAPWAPVMRKVNRLEQDLWQLKQSLSLREQRRFQAMAADFAAARDENGEPKYRFFSQVQPLMMRLLESGLAAGWEEAYRKALWMVPDIRKNLLKEQAENALKQKTEEAEKSRQAGFAVRGKMPAEDDKPLTTRQMLEKAIYGK